MSMNSTNKRIPAKPYKYPIGIQTFDQIIEGGFVYVDKTALIYELVSTGKIYFLSRPRRFGKSLLLSTLEHYFLGHEELFNGLAISELEEKWDEYPVFRIDLNGGPYDDPMVLVKKIRMFLETAEVKYGIEPDNSRNLDDRFKYILEVAHQQSKRRAVVLIDEYDKPLLDVMGVNKAIKDEHGNTVSLEEHNRSILRGFYSTFKSADKDLQFVMLTGVTKFGQISVFSGFNQPKDVSMDSRYETLCGITQAELEYYFEEPIHDLAAEYNVDHATMLSMLKRKYDGYHFGKLMIDMYNPFSIINCFSSLSLDNYWFSSGTPDYLIRLMQSQDEHINELAGKEYDPAQFADYKATDEQPLPMIYQSGYLTIKGYDRMFNTYLLDFPNEEVRSGFVSLLVSDYFKTNQRTMWLKEVSQDLAAGRVDDFLTRLKAFLSNISYRFRQKNDKRERERHFQYTFYLIMQMIGQYNTYVEKETSQGRIDCVVECQRYVYIFEFKLDGSAEKAIKQIHEKGYAAPYLADERPVYLLGINFSSETGSIDDVVVEEMKQHRRT